MLWRSTFLFAAAAVLLAGESTDKMSKLPRWWTKYQYLAKHAPLSAGPVGPLRPAGSNVNVSNECGPQSETYVALDPSAPTHLAGGSNEIFRLPMRGYASTGGTAWSGVDLPLPPAQGSNGTRFGSDPTLAFDASGNLFYGYIVVYFGNGSGVNGTAMAVARSTDGGRSYPAVTYFEASTGGDHFNDKPMITTDANPGSPFRNNVYLAWDAASGGSSAGGIRVAHSSDHGQTFSTTRADDPSGPGQAIGAVPFTGPNGELYVAWNDYKASAIVMNKSLDGGVTWGTPVTVARQHIGFEIAVPAQSSRGVLEYPACDADRSASARRGTLFCSWVDLNSGVTNIYVASSTDQGSTWSTPVAVTDALAAPADRFNQWLAVDPVNGDVNVSFYDTRNDTTGMRYMADIYLTRLTASATAWLTPNVRVSTQSSNEHDCGGVYPCTAINYGNQYGDYSGLASYGGVSYPFWTDSRVNTAPAAGCNTGLAMEEVFTAPVN